VHALLVNLIPANTKFKGIRLEEKTAIRARNKLLLMVKRKEREEGKTKADV
jgi:hypothetical protein